MGKEAVSGHRGPVTSHPIDICSASVTGRFWSAEQELVRSVVLPYQWRVLNDQVPGADPSYCMHNFRAAARLNQRRSEVEGNGGRFEAPRYTDRGFDVLPDDPKNPDPDRFYGFVFQDTDFSKWIEAVGYSLAHHPDAQLEATADTAIDVVCAAQLPNGYLDTFYILGGMDRHFTNLKDHHELYCMGHLIEGAVAYYEGTGKDKLLRAAERFADYVGSVFGTEPGRIHGYPGHEIAEMGLARLYEVTGEPRYLKLASYFIHQRGSAPLYFEQEDRKRAAFDGVPYEPNKDWPEPYAYYQAHRPVATQNEAVGHAVRAGYLYSGIADIARLTQDDELGNAVRALWRSIVDHKLYITGGMGSTAVGESFSYDYDLPNDLAYSETCAAVSLVFLARRMLQLEPKGEYADVMELALYNTVLAGIASDGKSFFYVNPLEVRPQTYLNHDSRFAHVSPLRRKWFGCACCPPNIARLVQSVQSYAYTLGDDGSTLFVHLYIGGEVRFALTHADSDAFSNICLEMQSEQPWSGSAKAKVHIASDDVDKPRFRKDSPGYRGSHDFTLAFHLPAWAGGRDQAAAGVGVVDAAGRPVTSRIRREVRDGYLYLTGEWHECDVVRLDFAMPVIPLMADGRVNEDAGKVAFLRGPIVYCAEESDNGSRLHELHVDTSDGTIQAQAEAFAFKAGSEGFGEDGIGQVDECVRQMVKLRVRAWRQVSDAHPYRSNRHQPLYYRWAPVRREPVTVTLIPYFAWANRGLGEMRVFLDAD